MQTPAIVHVIEKPAENSRAAYKASPDFNPLIEQASVKRPEKIMSDQANFAVGLIETQGFTGVFEAIDTALKTAAVEVLAREKLGGGYITVVIKGDVASVRAAVEAGKAKVKSRPPGCCARHSQSECWRSFTAPQVAPRSFAGSAYP